MNDNPRNSGLCLYKLGVTYGQELQTNTQIFDICFTKQVHSSSSTEHACNTFCRKKKIASVGCIF